MDFIQLIYSVFLSIFDFPLALVFFASLIFYSIFLFIQRILK